MSEQESTYEIHTDLPNYEGSKMIKIAGNSLMTYSFNIIPMVSGSTVGKIKFVNREDQSYLWYNVKVWL